MISKKEKGFRKLNKSNVASVFVLMLVLVMVLALFLSIFGVFFFRYFIDSRIRNEYASVSYMLRLYENSEDKDEAVRLLNKEGRSYIITDETGNKIYGNGEDTCGTEGFYFRSAGLDTDVLICPDINAKYIRSTGKDITFDISGIIEEAARDFSIGDMELRSKSVKVPVWIGIETEDGGYIYAQMFFTMDFADLAAIMALIAVIGLLILAGFIVMIVILIKGFSRQKKLNNLFFMDDVTGNRNWMWFQIQGERLVCQKKYSGTNFAVLDLVFVKYRNFCMCHSIEEGEKLLLKIDDLVNGNLNKKYEMCAHYASANFAVLMVYDNETELTARIRDLLGKLEHLDDAHKLAFHVGVDLLGAKKEQNGRSDRYLRRRNVEIDKEYNNACTARATLDETDDSNLAFFNEKLLEEQKWIDTVQERQQSALDNEEFIVYYQPKYDPQTDRLKGAEALIRWNSPEFGFKGPGAFIPIFEKNGFITEIDHYMIRHVARDQKRWLDAGFTCVPVSVNVSRAHFIEKDLAEQIRDMIDEVGTPHDLIELELTESAFFDDKNAIIETIKKLKGYGFTVSMDDFGSGYSSLNSLKDMPLDVLKLDAEFFRGEADDERREIVVSEAIRLARSLNMRTVAEGVEVEEQVEFLAGQGCDMIQGYYYAKPMPGNEYEERMSKG